MLSAVIAAMCLGAALAYPYQARFASMRSNVDCHKNPTPLSYHIHIPYMLTNEAEINSTIALRQRAIDHFRPMMGSDPVCQGTEIEPSGRYDNGRLCAIYDHDLTNDTLGPFPIGEWSFFVPVHYLGAVMPWFVQNRGSFTLLVHPNTGCENEDHSIWTQWSGPAWNLDMSIFTPMTQTNEFGEVLGTARNPSCATATTVCAFGNPKAPGYGPQVSCCAGLACNCDNAFADGNCYCK